MAKTKLIHNFQSRAEWKEAIDSAPKDSWIKNRSLGVGKKSLYVPIEIQQALADIFYDSWNVVSETYQQITNEILCTVKIEAFPSYPNAEPEIFTGSGTKPIQTRKGSRIEKFPAGKITNSLEYCLPASRSGAIGCAFATKGNVFGRHLNRKVKSNYSLPSPAKKAKDEKKVKKSKKSKDEKKHLKVA